MAFSGIRRTASRVGKGVSNAPTMHVEAGGRFALTSGRLQFAGHAYPSRRLLAYDAPAVKVAGRVQRRRILPLKVGMDTKVELA